MVTETFDYDGGRGVSVYVPERPVEAIVYAGDGQLIANWGADLDGGALPSTMVVGTHRLDDEMERLSEYTPVFDADRFAAHERFFVHDVGAWVRSQFGVDLPRERTAVCGVSASGELSLAIGLRHPDRFGAVFSSSPGGGFKPTGELLRGQLPRVYLTAGSLEPFFRDNARVWADALRSADADVVFEERQGDHGGPFWREEFPRMAAWAFASA